MGVQFDRILDRVDGPFARVDDYRWLQPAGTVGTASGSGWLDAVAPLQRRVHRGQPAAQGGRPVSAASSQADGIPGRQDLRAFPMGTESARSSRTSRTTKGLQRSSSLQPSQPSQPSRSDRREWPLGQVRRLDAVRLDPLAARAVRVPFEVVYPPTLDAGNLAAKFDVLIFPDGAIPASDRRSVSPAAASWAGCRRRTEIPAEYRARLGRITVAKTRSRRSAAFVEAGGRSSPSAARRSIWPSPRPRRVELTWSNGRRRGRSGRCRARSSTCRARCSRRAVDNTAPLAWGLGPNTIVFFDESPAFRLDRGAEAARAGAAGGLVRHRHAAPQRLGLGPDLPRRRRRGGGGAGRTGKVYLFGPEITFRAQPHGTFKFLFNAIMGREP